MNVQTWIDRNADRIEVARIIAGAVYDDSGSLSRATEAADAVLALLAGRGYRKHPEPDWEYAIQYEGYRPMPVGKIEAEILTQLRPDLGGRLLRRRAAGPWVPVGEGELSAAELTALLHRQSGTLSPALLWCPQSPTRDDDTYVPDGGGGCARCGHSTGEHEVRN